MYNILRHAGAPATGGALRRHRPVARLLALAMAILNLFILPFGTALGVVAMLTNAIFLLPIIGLLFVVEAGSSLIQMPSMFGLRCAYSQARLLQGLVVASAGQNPGPDGSVARNSKRPYFLLNSGSPSRLRDLIFAEV